MQTIESIQQQITHAFSRLVYPESPAELYEPIRYTLQLGGKRLRPFLLLASCDMFDGKMEEAIQPAIGLELFHNFTLLHDDLMDQAPLRRGKETVYKKWNANIAILSGDTMFALANSYMLHTRADAIPGLLELFNRTAIEVCEGQQYDMNFEVRNDVSISEYIHMIRLKTAVLLACSLKAGALIADAPKNQTDRIYDFGINVGIAFQLMDDLLDVYGSEDKFGKMKGGDILVAKKTFLYLKALELSENETERFQLLYESKVLPAEKKIDAVIRHFDKLGIYDLTLKEINKYWNTATSIMNAIGLPSEKSSLVMSYCSQLMERDF